MNNPAKDDVYAYALSKTLTKVSAPATVGLYSSCQDRINLILKQIEVHMKNEALRIEMEYKGKPRPRSLRPSLTGFMALICRLLFFRPIWTKENRQPHNIRFIHVHFSAWHFAGSDLLWAGLAIRLFQAMQINFGKLHLVLHRMAQYDEDDEVKKMKVEDSISHWRAKKLCCFPLWLVLLSLIVIPLISLVFLMTFGTPKPDVDTAKVVNSTVNQIHVFEGLYIAALGVPAASALRFLFLMCKNLIFTQDFNIRRGMDNEKVSSKLGFMNEVRKEMWFLSRFVEFMEVFERRRIRIVLQITKLDHCPPMKIVAVLDAINILLSDEESPFISILAVNPEVLVQKVNFADGCFIKEDQAHALLSRIVTLAFTIPPLSDDSRRNLFYNLTSNTKMLKAKNIKDDHDQIERKSSSDVPLVEITTETHEKSPLITTSTAILDVNEEEVESIVQRIVTNNEAKLNKYFLDDAMSMRRVINSFRMAVIIMKALRKGLPPTENIAAWVVLANHWPCRLSWIMQCVEDAQQRADIDGNTTDKSKTLWDVFNESKAELYVMSAEIEKFLELDGDPEMFERFLKEHFPFRIKDLETFQEVTVNLDQTIKKEMAKFRGTSTLKDSGWMRNLAPLPLITIINMKTEDVCEELERMKFPTKYIDIVKRNDLSGSALIFGDTGDLKELLDMTFGEWATFRMHFLSLKPQLRQQFKQTVPPSRYHLYSHHH